MSELTLVSKTNRPLKSLVQSALDNEVRLLESGIARSRQKLREYETRFHMQTADFIRQFEANELSETLDFSDWMGEYRMLKNLEEKVETIRGVRFEN